MSRIIKRNLLFKLGDKFRPFRARPHDTHFTFDYIVDLRQLIQACVAYKGAYSGNPAVIGGSLTGLTVFLFILPHTAVLVYSKLFTHHSYPGLAIQNRPPGFQKNGKRCENNERQHNSEKRKAYEQIQRPFTKCPSFRSFKSLREHN